MHRIWDKLLAGIILGPDRCHLSTGFHRYGGRVELFKMMAVVSKVVKFAGIGRTRTQVELERVIHATEGNDRGQFDPKNHDWW